MSNENKSKKCLHCNCEVSDDRTFCSRVCYCLWQIVTEGGTKPQPPELCKVNSLLGSVNSEFN